MMAGRFGRARCRPLVDRGGTGGGARPTAAAAVETPTAAAAARVGLVHLHLVHAVGVAVVLVGGVPLAAADGGRAVVVARQVQNLIAAVVVVQRSVVGRGRPNSVVLG